jgi:hypothetical protein
MFEGHVSHLHPLVVSSSLSFVKYSYNISSQKHPLDKHGFLSPKDISLLLKFHDDDFFQDERELPIPHLPLAKGSWGI